MNVRIIFGDTSSRLILPEDITRAELYNVVSKKLNRNKSLLKLFGEDDFGDLYPIADNETYLIYLKTIVAKDSYGEYLNAIFETDSTKKTRTSDQGKLVKSSKNLRKNFCTF